MKEITRDIIALIEKVAARNIELSERKQWDISTDAKTHLIGRINDLKKYQTDLQKILNRELSERKQRDISTDAKTHLIGRINALKKYQTDLQKILNEMCEEK